ncbi:hypothetical protein EP47_05385 [Legionella norrlandica]|uniref:Coiled coil domain-containing protein n=1 Tax=Legionella norrlandica TaxID=1498499 RepID=A0A0A2SUZ6_9GAMM|nr:hypothetical protein [Legionella norrlandica]KGP63556.1 hypothetical protein EP47_05385 [Legionella norrlandica]
MPFYNSLPLFGKHLKSESRTQKYSANEIKRLEREYRDSIGLGDNATFSSDAFDKLVSSRIGDFNGFSQTKGPSSTTIHDKLAGDTPEAKEVRDGLNKSLETTPEFTEAQKNFSESASTFKELTKLIPSKFRAQDLIGTMKELVDDGRKAILAQQQHEIKMLEEQFDLTKNPNFVPNLKKTLNLTSDNDVEKVKTNLLNDLKASHKKQQEEFDKTTSESLNKLHQAVANQTREYLFIVSLYENNKEMERLIENKMAEHRKKMGLPPETTKAFASIKDIDFSGVKLKDLPVLKGPSGMALHQQPDGSFVIKMPAINPLYYQDPRQNIKADLMLMAKAIYSTPPGHNSIEMDCDFPKSEKIGMERGRQAYAACIEAGFAPDKITIKVNGKVMKPEELFKEDKKTYQDLMKKVPKIEKDYAEISAAKTPTGPVNTTAVKEAVTAIKEQQKAKERAEHTEPQEQHGAKLT